MNKLDDYETELLSGWEEAHKKGQLTLLILLALKDGPKYMAEIKEFIKEVSDDTLLVDDKSMYRALRRHNEVEMIDFTQKPGDGGPDRKVYHLTPIGVHVLDAFIARNIHGLFSKPRIIELIGTIERTTK